MAQAIPIGIALAGAALSAGGSIIGANSEAKSMRSQADQLDVSAGSDRATSQRQAMEERRQAQLVSSRTQALAAASGGGADDPSVVNNMANIAGEGEYRAAVDLYNGNESAIGKENQATALRNGAKSVKTAGAIKAAGTILSAASSIGGRYAPASSGSPLNVKYG